MHRLLPLMLVLVLGCGPSAPPEFDKPLSEWLDDPGDFGEATEGATRGKIKRKLIPVDLTRKRIDADVYHALPEELRAATPEEVGTVVKIRWNEVPVTQGRTFFKVDAFFVDRETGKVISAFQVQGGASKFQNRSGTRPVDLVVNTIKQQVEARD